MFDDLRREQRPPPPPLHFSISARRLSGNPPSSLLHISPWDFQQKGKQRPSLSPSRPPLSLSSKRRQLFGRLHISALFTSLAPQSDAEFLLCLTMASHKGSLSSVSSNESRIEDSSWMQGNTRDLNCKYCKKVVPGNICSMKGRLTGSAVKNTLHSEKRESFRKRMRVPHEDSDVDEDDVDLRKKARHLFDGQKGRAKTPNPMDEAAKLSIAEFLYENDIPLSALTSPSFNNMIANVWKMTPQATEPSYFQICSPLMEEVLTKVDNLRLQHEDAWAKHGCSLLLDVWIDGQGKKLINFLVNSARGSFFLRSLDSSRYVRDECELYKLVSLIIDEIGEDRVIQVITNDARNMKLVGKFLEQGRPHIYWTPCAAQCIDLILQDIAKITRYSELISTAVKITSYIYCRPGVLNMMRSFTKADLVQQATTRFGTSYLTLLSLYSQKRALIDMFESNQWMESKWAVEDAGKDVKLTLSSSQFWPMVDELCKVLGPLVGALQDAAPHRKPSMPYSMPYVYGAMDRAKDAIGSFFSDKTKIRDVFEIIDRHWTEQFQKPLHACAHLLCPEYNYGNEVISVDLYRGFCEVVEKLNKEQNVVDAILEEFSLYKSGSLGSWPRIVANKVPPADWWSCFAGKTPNLKNFAIRVLNLTGASSCEKERSLFDKIQTRKRGHLDYTRMNRELYISYNRFLDSEKSSSPPKPLPLEESNEWIVGHAHEAEDWAHTTGGNRLPYLTRLAKHIMNDCRPTSKGGDGPDGTCYL